VAEWRTLTASKTRLGGAIAIAVVAGALAYSSAGTIRDTSTHVQDHLLLANANADLGRDTEAARQANIVLWDHPERREAQRIYTVSYFNLQLLGDPGAKLFGDWEAQRKWVIQDPPTDSIQDVILGTYAWQWGEPEKAVAIWRANANPPAEGAILARACLAATGNGPDVPPEAQALKDALVALFDGSGNTRTNHE
jgi:hypothetical protein